MHTLFEIIGAALQTSASIILMFSILFATRRSLVCNHFENSFIVVDQEKKIQYNKEAFRKACANRVNSWFALAYCIIGAFLSFADPRCPCYIRCSSTRILIFSLSVFSFTAIAFLSSSICKALAKDPTYDELKQFGIEPNMESITEKEIKDIVK